MAEDERPGTPPEEPGEDSNGEGAVDSTPAADPNESPTAGGPAEEPAAEEQPDAAEAPAEEPAAEEQPAAAEAPAEEQPAAAEAPAEEPAAEEQPAATEAPTETPAEEQPTAEEQPAAAEAAAEQEPQERQRRPRRRDDAAQESGEEVVPGAHLEPDLVLEEQQAAEDEFARYGAEEDEATGDGVAAAETPTEPAPVARTPMELAADARYRATGKRKTAVARVILRPGGGSYVINGRELNEFFPRETLRLTARQPLEAAGYASRMDVVAKIHGGGVSSQAGALRHGIARALVEADPNLRGELKRRGFLTRDARVKERKKAGLKKARKRPQFSKR